MPQNLTQTHEHAWHAVADVLADNPTTVARLLAEHSPDPDGMCLTCTDGGTGRRTTPSPCPIRYVADLATASIANTETRP